MEIREMIEKNGGIKNYSEKYGIPYRTVQNWKSGVNEPSEWLKNLLDRINTLENHIDFLDEEISYSKKLYQAEKEKYSNLLSKVSNIIKSN